jgi:hypothetical protein
LARQNPRSDGICLDLFLPDGVIQAGFLFHQGKRKEDHLLRKPFIGMETLFYFFPDKKSNPDIHRGRRQSQADFLPAGLAST